MNLTPVQQRLFSMSMDDALKAFAVMDSRLTDLKAIRMLAQQDLFYLMVRVCKRTDLCHPWVYERCREVQQHPDGYLDLWGREHFKSSLITFGLTVQNILNNPTITVAIISEKWSIASQFLCHIKREFETNELLKKVFPDIFYRDPEYQSPTWSNDQVIVKRATNPREPTITAMGLDGVKVGSHYDVLVYDDIITFRSVNSKEMIDKVTAAFEISLSLSKQGGIKRFIGTRYHFADTYDRILNPPAGQAPMAIPRIYPATDDGTPSGTPVLFSPEYWAIKLTENDAYNLACQYLQNPQAGTNPEFDLNDLNWWEVRSPLLECYLLCDPGIRKTSSACDTAMVVIGVTKQKHLYLLDGRCHKMTMSERWENYKTLYQKWKAQPGVTKIHCGYEIYGSGQNDIEFFQTQMSKENLRFPITELEGGGPGSRGTNKLQRIRQLEPDLKGHKIFMPLDPSLTMNQVPTERQQRAEQTGHRYLIAKAIKVNNEEGKQYDLTKVFMEQLKDFPFGAKVDLLDAFARLYDMGIRTPTDLTEKYGRTIIFGKRKDFGGPINKKQRPRRFNQMA